MTFQPSRPGKHQVEHADVGALEAKAGEPGLAVGDAHRIESGGLEVTRHALCDDVVVFDDQDLRAHSDDNHVPTRPAKGAAGGEGMVTGS